MARGGTITPRRLQDGSISWVLQWRVGGRQVKRTVRGSRKDAEAALTAVLAARDRGEHRRVSTEAFAAYAATWLAAKQPRLEAAAYLAAAPDLYRPLAELLISTGLRIGEAVALEWADVDLEALTIRVSRSWKLGGAVGGTKSDRARIVHIDPDLAAMLDQQRRSRTWLGRLVFATENGGMLDPANVRNRWHDRTLKAARLPPIRLHDLRHTAATLAVTAGESVLFVQAQLGHADVRTTQRYAHADHRAHREAAARVAAFRKSVTIGRYHSPPDAARIDAIPHGQ